MDILTLGMIEAKGIIRHREEVGVENAYVDAGAKK